MITPTREQVVQWLEMADISPCVSPIDRATQIMAATKIVTIARSDLEATISELTAKVDFWINSRNELQQADDAIIAGQAKEIERLQEHSTYVDRQTLQLGRELAELTAQRDEAMKAIGLMVEWFKGADHSTGYCCCGMRMDTHGNPMNEGHSPLDEGDYHAMKLINLADAAIAKGKG